MVEYYDIKSLIISLPIQLFTHPTWVIFIHDLALFDFFVTFSVIFYCFVLRNVNNRLSLIRKNKKRINRFVLHQELRQFMSDHNEICRLILKYNIFWNKLYFSLFLTLVPANLILLHTIFFEKTSGNVKTYLIFVTILLMICIFLFQYLYAYITKQVHKNTKLLAHLQWNVKGWPFRLATKLKLMAYFERLNANKKIGLTLGPTITLTFPVFAQVL